MQNAINSRHSSRGLFDPAKLVPEEHLLQILESARWSPTAHNMQNFEILILDDRNLINRIADFPRETSMSFIWENYYQLSATEEELKQRKTGVLGSSFPESWRKPELFEQAKTEAEGNDFLTKQLKSSPMLGLVLYDPRRRAPASEGDFLGIMSLGCVLENIWLTASELGIDLHVISSLSEESVEQNIKNLTGIPEHLRIAISFRLGYALHPGDTIRVRKDIGDFVYHNRYDIKYKINNEQ